MSTNSFLKGIGLGLAIGALAGVMLAPKSGRETRGDIKRFTADINEKWMRKFSEIKGMTRAKYESFLDQLMAGYQSLNLTQDQKEEIKDELRSSFDRIKQIVREEE